MKMADVKYTGLLLLTIFLTTVTSYNLLCYDCDAGRECQDPVLHNVRTVNCNKQYPDPDGQLVCLTLDITLPEGKAFNVHKSGFYRGCRVIPTGEESNFCENLKIRHADRLRIESCKYCNTTRCLP